MSGEHDSAKMINAVGIAKREGERRERSQQKTIECFLLRVSSVFLWAGIVLQKSVQKALQKNSVKKSCRLLPDALLNKVDNIACGYINFFIVSAVFVFKCVGIQPFFTDDDTVGDSD